MDCVFVIDRHVLSEVEVSRYEIVESLMRAFLIIEEEVVCPSSVEVRHGLVSLEVEVLIKVWFRNFGPQR